VDSHQLLVQEASSKARLDGYADGFLKGLTEGEKRLRESLQISADFSLAQELLDKLLFEEPVPIYTENAIDRALELAVSWRRGREMLFWVDVERYLHREYKARMRKMREGEIHQQELLTFIEGLSMLPRMAARVEEKYHGDRTAVPEQKVIRRGNARN